MNDGPSQQPPSWERDAILGLATSALDEQKKARRWNTFFKLAFLGYLLVILALSPACQKTEMTTSGEKHTAVVHLDGVISEGSYANAEDVNRALKKAFEAENSVAVMLQVNSPGGSPVQSDFINKEIYRLRKAHPDKPIYAVVTETCASGCYYVTVAADKIFANGASMVGSIGVLMDSYGFNGTMELLGVDRRLITAGKNKGFMDPFSPARESDLEHARSMVSAVHQQFIDVVKAGRGERLVEDETLFSGLVWTGATAKSLGLIDDLLSPDEVLRDLVGVEKTIDYSPKPSLMQQFSQQFGLMLKQALEQIRLG